MKQILFSLVIAIASCICNAQEQKYTPYATIDSIVHAHMVADKMAGVSVGIVKDRALYFTRGYGTTEINGTTGVDSITNFLTCSITKLFTATAIMQLVEAGKLDINQKLIYYLPWFRMKDPRYRDITIKHLLTHSSGLPWDAHLKHSPDDSTALRRLVESLKNKKLAFAPGTRFDATKTYSNAAFDILGFLVQSISGMPYSVYVTENILKVANMNYSTFDYRTVPENRRAVPHLLKKNTVVAGGMFTENAEHTPSGNLNSCSLDLCYWVLHCLRICNASNSFRGVLQHRSLLQMWTPVYTTPQKSSVSIGLGWFITHSKELGTYYWHVGDDPGFSATVMIFPESDFGIVVLSNGMYAEQTVWNKVPFDIIALLRKTPGFTR